MLAVAAPAEAIACAFKVARSPEGNAIDLARIARAFEFMDAGRQEWRIGSLRNPAAFCQSLKVVLYLAGGLQGLVLLQERRTLMLFKNPR